MWYEVIPASVIILAGLAVPCLGSYALNKFFLGQPYTRDIRSNSELYLFLRDMRVSQRNFAYGYKGLETIPEEDVKN